MALFSKFKNMFGFSDEEYETTENAEDIQRDATVTPLNQRRLQSPAATSAEVAPTDTPTEASAAESIDDTPTAVPEQIFARVVEIFNESLPPFIAQAVDRDAQCRYIHEALDESMRDYIARLAEDSDRRTTLRWKKERDEMHRQMHQLREKAAADERNIAEWREQKLSAERQKRALSERVHDLEAQIDAHQAEREQFDIENKSLVNKLRAVSIQEKDMEALQADNNALRARINQLMTANADGAESAVAEMTDQSADLNRQIDELRTQNESLEAELAKLTEANNSLTIDIETFKKRCEIADSMINDLNHKATSAQSELAARDAELAQMRASASTESVDTESLTKQIAELSDKLRVASQQLEARDEELRAANEEVEVARTSLAEFESSLDKFDEVINAKDNLIAELRDKLNDAPTAESTSPLQAELDKANAEIDRVNAELEKANGEIASLKSTIDNNLHIQAQSEAALRAQIDELRATPEKTRTRRRKESAVTAIDESLDDTNWLVATPPEGTSARLTNLTDDEFGYHEPKRSAQPPLDDTTQMSLW